MPSCSSRSILIRLVPNGWMRFLWGYRRTSFYVYLSFAYGRWVTTAMRGDYINLINDLLVECLEKMEDDTGDASNSKTCYHPSYWGWATLVWYCRAATANKIYEPYKFTFLKSFTSLFINIPKAETVLNLALNMHAEKGEIMQLPTYQE